MQGIVNVPKERELLWWHREEGRTSLQKPSEEEPEQLKPVLNTEPESCRYGSLEQQHPVNDPQSHCSLGWTTAPDLLLSGLRQAPELLSFSVLFTDYHSSRPTLSSFRSWWEMGGSETRPEGSRSLGEPELMRLWNRDNDNRLAGSFFLPLKSEGSETMKTGKLVTVKEVTRKVSQEKLKA